MPGGFGAMLSFEVDSEELARAVPQLAKLFVDATSLASPCRSSHPILIGQLDICVLGIYFAYYIPVATRLAGRSRLPNLMEGVEDVRVLLERTKLPPRVETASTDHMPNLLINSLFFYLRRIFVYRTSEDSPSGSAS
jgi:hypothetical protein